MSPSRCFLFTAALLTASLCVSVQDTTTYLHPDKVSFMAEDIFFSGKSFQSAGINLQFAVGRHGYLNYHFGFGTTSDGGLYAHSTLGGAGGMALVVNSIGEKGVGWLAFILLLVPEGAGYSIPIGNKMELVPYVDPLQCDYRIKESTYGEEFNFSGDAGARFCFKFRNRLFFEPHLGAKLLYNSGEWGLEGGASIGKFF
jgi:hypothetical protein